MEISGIVVRGASEHNLKNIDVEIPRGALTVITGVSGSGKSSLAFDTILAEAQRRFFYTLSNYSRQFLDMGSRPAVKSISGLSPAVALAQNETMPSRRSSVGSISDVSELLGVCFARFGEKCCPEHGLPTTTQSTTEVAERLLSEYEGRTIVLAVPVAEQKKGNFTTRLSRFGAKGFVRAYVDGKVVSLSPPPPLVKEEKHTIKVFIDAIRVSKKSLQRLQRSIETTLAEGDGFGEYFVAESSEKVDLNDGGRFSDRGGCGVCGFSWPAMDARYFSANSLGKCDTCSGYGTVDSFDLGNVTYEFEYEDETQLGGLDLADLRCQECFGTGIGSDVKAITIHGKSVIDLQLMSVSDLIDFFEGTIPLSNAAFVRVAEQIRANLSRIKEVGLEYLQICRRVRTLSGGELQRLKLAGILGESLKGVLYVLDEPSQGLHPTEIESLCDNLDRLKKYGNTLIVVDHDETMMRRADIVIDLGPGGGTHGGEVMAKFNPRHAQEFVHQSLTARHLTRGESRMTPVAKKIPEDPQFITISKPTLHNLKMDRVKFLKNALNVVSGVSGAGKSSLVLSVLYENISEILQAKKEGDTVPGFRFCKSIEGLDDFDRVHLIDRKPVAKSSVSLPATYLDIFTDLRELYGRLPESQIMGLSAPSFSLAREGGRCESCKGRGEMSLQMRFLADARVRCYVCGGMRYRPHLLDVRYNGLNLAEVLDLTIDEALQHFKTFTRIQKRLQPAVDLGLGYLKLGQPSASLSGGEAQRLKLSPLLGKKFGRGSLVILDEPTTGLHFEDVERLLTSLQKLIALDATVILVEHNAEVILASHWLVDLGPGAADRGGRLMYEGDPAGIVNHDSPTGLALTH